MNKINKKCPKCRCTECDVLGKLEGEPEGEQYGIWIIYRCLNPDGAKHQFFILEEKETDKSYEKFFK